MVDRIIGVVIARDEEQHLGPCLESLNWTDGNLVVLDNRTTDRSDDVATGKGAAVLAREFQSFPVQRNAALEAVRSRDLGEWVIFLDADERVTAALAEEIRSVVDGVSLDRTVGYWIPRRNFIWDCWIRHGGWSPDHQLRLLKVEFAHYDETRDVHELVNLHGRVQTLNEAMIHYNYDGFGQFWRKQWQYSRLEAQRLRRNHFWPRPASLVRHPVRDFYRRYVELRGYRDGWRGLALAALLALYTETTYLRLIIRRLEESIKCRSRLC